MLQASLIRARFNLDDICNHLLVPEWESRSMTFRRAADHLRVFYNNLSTTEGELGPVAWYVANAIEKLQDTERGQFTPRQAKILERRIEGAKKAAGKFLRLSVEEALDDNRPDKALNELRFAFEQYGDTVYDSSSHTEITRKTLENYMLNPSQSIMGEIPDWHTEVDRKQLKEGLEFAVEYLPEEESRGLSEGILTRYLGRINTLTQGFHYDLVEKSIRFALEVIPQIYIREEGIIRSQLEHACGRLERHSEGTYLVNIDAELDRTDPPYLAGEPTDVAQTSVGS